MPPESYVKLLFEELRQKHRAFPKGPVDTVYFGGGTPSLISAELIVSLLEELAKYGFTTRPETEITIEINPATVDPKKMEMYLKAGINRFSVGAQSFDDRLLKMVHREHNAEQTRQTLRLLQSYKVNYSFDVLFALPHQTVDGLKKDLDEVLAFDPPHVSPYCLTVPEGHVLTKNRPLEDEQIEMFDLISNTLKSADYHRYEISNFSKKGFESRHNSLYWDNSQYWGLGLSAHSYMHEGPWGLRFWNASSIGAYEQQIKQNQAQEFSKASENLPAEQFEFLKKNQALTDFCHTSLRTALGLNENDLISRFSTEIKGQVVPQLKLFAEQGLLENHAQNQWRLTDEGLVLSNQVFAGLTYLEGELR